MKDVRPQFTEEEYFALRAEADRLGVSLKRLVRDRALGIATEDTPLCSAKLLCIEMAAYREVLNQIIQRETQANIHLYENDIIRMEMSVSRLEDTVIAYVRTKLREEKSDG